MELYKLKERIMLNSIKKKILSIQFLTLFLTLIALIGINFFITKTIFKKNEVEYMEHISKHINDTLFNEIKIIKEKIHLISNDESLKYYVDTKKESALDYLLLKYKDFSPLIGYLDSNGKEEILELHGELLHLKYNIKRSPLYEEAINNPNKIIISPIIEYDECLKESVIKFAINRTNYFGDEFYGLIFGSLPLSKLLEDKYIDELSFKIRILDKDGKIQFSTNKYEEGNFLIIEKDLSSYLSNVVKSQNIEDSFEHLKVMNKNTFTYKSKLYNDTSIILISQNYDRYMELPFQMLKLQSSIFLSIFILVSIASYIFLIRNIIKPIEVLKQATKEIAMGDYSHKIDIKTGDEIEKLADSFNVMNEQLVLSMSVLNKQKIKVEEANLKLNNFNLELEKEVQTRTKELEKSKELLEILATTDSLTQICNRHAIMERLDEEINRNKRYNIPLCVLLFDIDDFKKVNDTYGHDVGDDILVSLVNLIKEALRDIDIFGRYGGEEFLIIFPNTSMLDAKIVAERIRLNAANHKFDKVGKVTISLGLVECNVKDNHKELFKRLDNLLYESKKNGKNKLTF
jgi:diguanylate cyclase (GGDEF)-like protein